MSDIDFSKFPIISTHDFEYVEIDALKIEDDVYVAMLNFFKENEEEDNSVDGFSLDTAIYGETLKELFDKIGFLFNSGLFDNINVGTHGSLWGIDGERIDSICWMHEGGIEVDHDHDESGPEETKPTLH